MSIFSKQYWADKKQARMNAYFWYACRTGKKEDVEKTLAEGADINAKNEEGWSGLAWAVRYDNLEIARLLVSKGADIHIKGLSRAYDSPGLHFFITEETLLMLVCRNGNERMADMLIQNGVDLAVKGNMGWTALHFAAALGHKNIFETLTEHGGDLKAVSNEGKSPLHVTAEYGRFLIVEMLVAKGVDVNVMDNNGNTPAVLAQKNGHHGLADFLREQGKTVVVETGWELTSPEEIIFTSEKKGYCLTQIFNFKMRTCTQIARNLETNAESQTMRFFDEFPDKEAIDEARRELEKQGGRVRDVKDGRVPLKKSL